MLLQIGGVPAVLKYLLQKGFLHGDCMTVTGTNAQQHRRVTCLFVMHLYLVNAFAIYWGFAICKRFSFIGIV